jgi:hypothetical protein
VLCLLLILLWVRSYSTADSCRFPAFNRTLLHIQSGSGQLIAFTFPYSSEWKAGSTPIEHIGPKDVLTTPVISSRQSLKFYNGAGRVAVVPYWFVISIGGLLAAGSWLRWQFSLRTLLIAATLVAVGLGLLVMMLRGS